MIPLKVPDWWDSIRSITTFQIVTTYCFIMLTVTIMSCILCGTGKEVIGKELLFFIVGSFSGTVVGAIVAYHFKQQDTKTGETTTTTTENKTTEEKNV